MITALHLAGSPTSEFFADLSRLYAADCLRTTADDSRWKMCVAWVGPDQRWRFPASLDEDAIAASPPLSLAAALEHVQELAPDVVLPQMFCLTGMTTYRALLEALGLRYIGNRPHVMATGASKPLAKAAVAAAGVRVPAGVTVTRERRDQASFPDLPVVVKPADADNSDGLTLVRTRHQLSAALDSALELSDGAIVEQYIPAGREVRCAVLDLGGELQVLPLEEYDIDPVRKPIRTAADKLIRRDGQLTLVAKNSERAWIVPAEDPVNDAVGAAAQIAHRALGCRDYSLFDFRIDDGGNPWFLEAGLYCSFASTSVVATMAAADGIAIPELFARAVRHALNRAEA